MVFSEFPELNDESITRFMNVTDAIGDIGNQTLRQNAVGTFQANVGIWQILARQGEIPNGEINKSWQKIDCAVRKDSPLHRSCSTPRVTSLGEVMVAAAGKAESVTG